MKQSTCLRKSSGIRRSRHQDGSAIVIALFVLALISVFVAMALSKSAAEAAATGNETTEGKTFYAAQGSLETMTRNFNKVFEVKLSPTNTELNAVRNGAVPGMTGFNFVQELDQTSNRENVVLSGGPFTGLYAIRDNWRLRTTATHANTQIQVQLTRNVLNNRVPIFQFGIFYEDDLELYRPPRFSFGGRVHTNGNFFVSPGADGIYFDSRVTAVNQIVTQTWRNGYTGDSTNNETWIKNASGVFKQLQPTEGSVLNTTAGAADNVFMYPPAAPTPVPTPNADLPASKLNANWATQSTIFDGNLQNRVQELKLPIKIDDASAPLISMIKRGKKIASSTGGDLFNDNGTLAAVTAGTADSDILKEEKFANKSGIRISLADSKAKLPGCASGTGTAAITGACGVRLDGAKNGTGPVPVPSPAATPDRARGYQPKSMKNASTDTSFNYVPTRVNGERLHTGGSREVWIKVETVEINAVTGDVVTKDITEDFLALGVTEVPPSDITITSPGYTGTSANNGTFSSPSSNLTSSTAQTASTYPDSRSVIKLQRWAILGPQINASSTYIYSWGSGSSYTQVARRYTGVDNDTKVNNGCNSGCTAIATSDPNSGLEHLGHLKRASFNSLTNQAIVPFPIELFDSREGEYYDDDTKYGSTTVGWNGVMSLVDIDIANLRRFLRGDFDNLFPATTNFPTGLKSTDIPQREGWVIYVSDRRGDADFDGEYDMEDVYGADPGNDGTLQSGEDVNENGVLDAKYMNPNSEACIGSATTCEAAKYADTVARDLAAIDDHKYYRRGIRLINGTTLPGRYDTTTPSNTRGFTVASENGIYVLGNYNSTGVASIPSTGNTPSTDYLPSNTVLHIPASVVGDAITILSNSWNDAKSFSSPYNQSNRLASETTIRFAMISGDSISTYQTTPHQGGISPRLNGGVHNFKRFLERWTNPSDSSFSVNLNYAGSLINLYNSRNNNGSFKCCDTVYNPPVRNWVFDSTFLDPNRLPPGTPYFQYVQTTGFQRTND